MTVVGTSVYLIQCADSGCIKIGLAGDVERRLAELQTGTPSELSVLAAAPGGRELEQSLHKKLAKHRVRGEWFYPSTEVLALVEFAQHQQVGRRTGKLGAEQVLAFIKDRKPVLVEDWELDACHLRLRRESVRIGACRREDFLEYASMQARNAGPLRAVVGANISAGRMELTGANTFRDLVASEKGASCLSWT